MKTTDLLSSQLEQLASEGKITAHWLFQLPVPTLGKARILLLNSAERASFLREQVPGMRISDAVVERLAKANDPKAAGKKVGGGTDPVIC